MIALLVVAGCGGGEEERGSDRERIVVAVGGYFDALAAGDGEAACERLTEPVAQDAATRVRAGSCPAAIDAIAGELDDDQRAVLRDVQVTAVDVTGSRARVEARSDARALAGPIPLERAGDEWRIADLPLGDPTTDARADRASCVLGGMDEFDAGSIDAYWRGEGRRKFERYMDEVCRRAIARGVGMDDADALGRIGRAVLRDLVREGLLSAP